MKMKTQLAVALNLYRLSMQASITRSITHCQCLFSYNGTIFHSVQCIV